MKEKVNVSIKPSSPEELQELVGKMTPEQLADLKAAIQKMEEEPKAQGGIRDRSGGKSRRTGRDIRRG